MKTINSLLYQMVSFLIEKYIQHNSPSKEGRNYLRDFKQWVYFELELNKN